MLKDGLLFLLGNVVFYVAKLNKMCVKSVNKLKCPLLCKLSSYVINIAFIGFHPLFRNILFIYYTRTD